MKTWLLLLIGLLAIGLLAACGGDDDSTPSSSATAVLQSPTVVLPTSLTPTPVPVPITEQITVFAASSLTDAFTKIGADYEAAFPGVGVNLTFGGSQDLRTQLEQGAQADVYASADVAQMDAAAASGVVTGLRRVFATNKLVIIVPKKNEAAIKTPQDLAKPGIKIVIGAESAPVGRYTRLFLDTASTRSEFGVAYKEGVLSNVVSEAGNVKEVVAAVQLDEVDAGVVYATDVTDAISEDVSVIEIQAEVNQTARYPIALTFRADSNEAAQNFIEYVLDDAGQQVLASFGFGETEG